MKYRERETIDERLNRIDDTLNLILLMVTRQPLSCEQIATVFNEVEYLDKSWCASGLDENRRVEELYNVRCPLSLSPSEAREIIAGMLDGTGDDDEEAES